MATLDECVSVDQNDPGAAQKILAAVIDGKPVVMWNKFRLDPAVALHNGSLLHNGTAELGSVVQSPLPSRMWASNG